MRQMQWGKVGQDEANSGWFGNAILWLTAILLFVLMDIPLWWVFI